MTQLGLTFAAPCPGVSRDDVPRLARQQAACLAFMSDGRPHTIAEVAQAIGASEAGAAARIRCLRQARHGGHVVERRRIAGGLWSYTLTLGGEGARR